MHLQLFLFCERYLAVRPIGQGLNIQCIVLHPLFSTTVFLIKLFKNFEEQGEDFFNVISDSLIKILDHTA